MAEPSEKSSQIETFLEKLFGRTSAIRENRCASCHKEAMEFKDSLSAKEYLISGLCQICQDEVWQDDD